MGSVNIPGGGNFHWKSPVLTVGDLPVSGNQPSDARITLDTFDIYVWNGASWDAASGGVSSVNGQTGVVVLDTGDISENGNLYFTESRVRSTPITGFVSGSGTVGATDTILQAINKLDGNDALKIPLTQKGSANGVATLDSGSKIPASQLPSTVMEYKGSWAPSTNTPTLANGTGDNGDVYRASDSGTVDFGAGPLTFSTGDLAIYNGSIYQKAPAADGVSSVNGYTGAIVLDADDLLITGYVSGAGTVAATDSILEAIQKLNGNTDNVSTVANAALPSASFTDAAVSGKLITGFSSGAGTVAGTDTILQAINKLDGNVALKAPLASPTFSGTVILEDTSAAIVQAVIRNLGTSVGSDAHIRVQTQVGGGDAHALFQVQSGQAWAVGLDQSDSSNFKISASIQLGTDDRITITPAGVITTSGNINGASPTEMSYLSGVSSAIQTQLNGKQASGSYATTTLNNLGTTSINADLLFSGDNLRSIGTNTVGAKKFFASQASNGNGFYVGSDTIDANTVGVFTEPAGDPIFRAGNGVLALKSNRYIFYDSPNDVYGFKAVGVGTRFTIGSTTGNLGLYGSINLNNDDASSIGSSSTGLKQVFIAESTNGNGIYFGDSTINSSTMGMFIEPTGDPIFRTGNSVVAFKGDKYLFYDGPGGTWVFRDRTSGGSRLTINGTSGNVVSQGTFSGTGANLSGLTASRVVVTDSSKNLASGIDSTFLDATSSIQTQLDSKLSSAQPTARAHGSSTTVSSTDATVVWDAEDFDTASAFAATTTGLYTLPSDGKYQVNVGLRVQATYALNDTTEIKIRKNGSDYSYTLNRAQGAVSWLDFKMSDLVSGVAGDTIAIIVRSTATSPTIASDNSSNYVSIAKVSS